jgi:hypothetical protein
MGNWDDYFMATAGASAALTGLLFVGVSLNLNKVLSIPHLPGRALSSLTLLVNIMLISSFCLVPGQPMWCLGAEVFLLGVVVWILTARVDIKSYRSLDPRYKFHFYRNQVFTQSAVLPCLAGGVCLVNGAGAGYYLLIPGITVSFIKALIDSWVLLIEINR